MSIRTHKFKKGDMVRYLAHRDPYTKRRDRYTNEEEEIHADTLGIVLEQDGMKIHVSWVVWPKRYMDLPWVNVYELVRVEA